MLIPSPHIQYLSPSYKLSIENIPHSSCASHILGTRTKFSPAPKATVLETKGSCAVGIAEAQHY